jgi:hypothetical protein
VEVAAEHNIQVHIRQIRFQKIREGPQTSSFRPAEVTLATSLS